MKNSFLFILLISLISASSIAQKPKQLLGKWQFAKIVYKGETIDKNNPETSKKALFKMMHDADPSTTEDQVESSFALMLMVFDMMTYEFQTKGIVKVAGTKGTYTLKKNLLTIKTEGSDEETKLNIQFKDNYLLMGSADAKDQGDMYFTKADK
ncbi:MAG: hypothetical protein WCP57_01395 [Bacteroidota bacterium]